MGLSDDDPLLQDFIKRASQASWHDGNDKFWQHLTSSDTDDSRLGDGASASTITADAKQSQHHSDEDVPLARLVVTTPTTPSNSLAAESIVSDDLFCQIYTHTFR